MKVKKNSFSELDIHHLRVAEGWLGQGNLKARAEMDKIRAELRSHPDVLEILWKSYANEANWGICLDIARAITIEEPGRVSGWIHLAHSARWMSGGTAQIAYDILLSAINKIPEQAAYFCDLARYACQLDRLEEARQWLEKAFRVDNSAEFLKKAFEDPDLKKLRGNYIVNNFKDRP